MNRREFISGIAAAGLAPMVPVPALTASASAAAPAAVAGNFTPYMYSWGVHHARTFGQCSPQILAETLGVQMDVANAINMRLIKKGIISAPNVLGISRATDPLTPPTDTVSVQTVESPRVAQAETTSRTDIGETLDKFGVEDEPGAEAEPDTLTAQPEDAVQSEEPLDEDGGQDVDTAEDRTA